jgi:hypothetical protein
MKTLLDSSVGLSTARRLSRFTLVVVGVGVGCGTWPVGGVGELGTLLGPEGSPQQCGLILLGGLLR